MQSRAAHSNYSSSFLQLTVHCICICICICICFVWISTFSLHMASPSTVRCQFADNIHSHQWRRTGSSTAEAWKYRNCLQNTQSRKATNERVEATTGPLECARCAWPQRVPAASLFRLSPGRPIRCGLILPNRNNLLFEQIQVEFERRARVLNFKVGKHARMEDPEDSNINVVHGRRRRRRRKTGQNRRERGRHARFSN